MTIQEFGSIGEFIGALAVLVTLVYLSIQTRLTRKAAEETANFASSQATYSAVEAYARWRSSILENPELARIMVKAREPGPLEAAEKVVYEQLFEQLFFAAAVSVQSSAQNATFHAWDSGDVAFLLEVFKANPAGVDEWQRIRQTVRAVSPILVDTVDAELKRELSSTQVKAPTS